MSCFWRRVIVAYCRSKFSVELEYAPAQRGFPRKIFTVNQEIPEPSTDPVVPRVFALYPNQPYFNLKKIWSSCHTPFVPPAWSTHCWKVLQMAYHTTDRTNLNFTCNYCGAPDTLSHRYFQCPAIAPIWLALNTTFPSIYPMTLHRVNWFFQISSSFLDMDYRVVMFITALWAIHTSFLENMNNNQIYNNLPYLRLSSYTTMAFQNIIFGTN